MNKFWKITTIINFAVFIVAMIAFGMSASAGVSSEATPDEAETISVQIIDNPDTATPDEAPTETVTRNPTKPTEPPTEKETKPPN
jgi:outer membrane biosynthesis protein TonB